MKNLFAFVVIGCMSGTLIGGCEKTAEQTPGVPAQNVRYVRQEANAGKTEIASEWQTFKAEAERKLEANQKRIDAFKVKMDKAGFKAKAKYNKEVAVLEKANRDLKSRLDEYKDEGEGKWSTFKKDFKHDMDAVGKTMSDLFKDNG